MNVPIMICAFNRPDFLSQVIDSIRNVRPVKLYLALDAPREDRRDDVAGCNACKSLYDSIDWDCDIKTNFAQDNMGCGKRMTTAISWVFRNEDRAIILEDDCVPDATFFRYCEELLDRYNDDSRVGAICGHSEHLHLKEIDFHGKSYYFDRMFSCWGWATWRRVWEKHEPTLPYLAELCESGSMLDIFRSRRYERLWRENIWKIRDGRKNTWAGAFATTLYKEGMLCIHPTVNLISNVGYGTSSRISNKVPALLKRHRPPFSHMPTSPMRFPMSSPISMIPSLINEKYCLEDALYATICRKIIRDPFAALERMMSIFLKIFN